MYSQVLVLYVPLLFLSKLVPSIWSMLYTLLNADGVVSFLSIITLTLIEKKKKTEQKMKTKKENTTPIPGIERRKFARKKKRNTRKKTSAYEARE